MSVQIGFWEHYKRRRYISHQHGRYFVVGVGRHTENSEQLVAYFPLYQDDKKGIVQGQLSFRPLSMWYETVQYEGGAVQRFTKITNSRVIHDLSEVIALKLPMFNTLFETARKLTGIN